ncbi:Aminoglycoside phosphotransferase [Streptomyces sp. CBMAI 2042]|uniref:aminoglycoside phosphotransferase n=1 Tax=Streptomyces sp. CBMAI 2042 TaxID=2305222 RepID=UPI000F1B35E1|nr:aminoglycoside phosphotransferase [Streptomyces sp. CBMAI 2042]RLV68130.1 Aminoglycoside phosphotransferase [Streptomyces sp. CBMAI 2042]
MATTRIGLDRLPPAARSAVEAHTGPLLTVEESTEGFNSEIAARVTSTTGTWHIKGLRTDHPRAWTQRREAAVAPFLTGLAPALRWRVESAGWDLLGFEALDGHHADYAPGSPDVPEVAALLRRLGDTPCPSIELRHAEQRLEHYAAHPDDLRLFAGTHLLHTDLNNANVLVDTEAPQGDRARLVDWAWATRGAAWLDAGYWIIWLIAAGHTPASAEHWAAEIPSWHTAPAEGITAFAAANANLWSEINTADPDPWTLRLATAATAWHAHRRTG